MQYKREIMCIMNTIVSHVLYHLVYAKLMMSHKNILSHGYTSTNTD